MSLHFNKNNLNYILNSNNIFITTISDYILNLPIIPYIGNTLFQINNLPNFPTILFNSYTFMISIIDRSRIQNFQYCNLINNNLICNTSSILSLYSLSQLPVRVLIGLFINNELSFNFLNRITYYLPPIITSISFNNILFQTSNNIIYIINNLLTNYQINILYSNQFNEIQNYSCSIIELNTINCLSPYFLNSGIVNINLFYNDNILYLQNQNLFIYLIIFINNISTNSIQLNQRINFTLYITSNNIYNSNQNVIIKFLDNSNTYFISNG
jgi:hypothetical protein